MLRTILFTFIIVISNCIHSQIRGKVIAISDGDTYTLLTDNKEQIKIRMFGIDAPESHQDFGNRSKQYLSSIIFGKEVYVIDKGLDKYKRTLGITNVQDSIDVAEVMLYKGMAWHYEQYYKSIDYAGLQENAKANRRGLWQNQNAIAPWNFRRGVPNEAPSQVRSSGNVTNTRNTESTVYICNGKNAYAYHSHICSGASRCRSGISKVSVSTAKSRGYRPCKICY